MFAFVWLPRDELTTRRRVAIGEMIEQAAGGRDHQLVGRPRRRRPRAGPLHAQRRRRSAPTPDVAALDRKLDAMVRGWEPSVEEALGELVGAAARDPPRPHLSRPVPRRLPRSAPAPRTRRTTSSAWPASKTPATATSASTAADDDAGDRLRLKTYRLGGDHPAVRSGAGVREFRLPGARGDADPGSSGGAIGYIHEFDLQMPGGGDAEAVLKRAEVVERAIADGARRQGRERRVQPADRRRPAWSRARSSCSAPGSAICARPAFPTRWSPWSRRCAARPRSPRA